MISKRRSVLQLSTAGLLLASITIASAVMLMQEKPGVDGEFGQSYQIGESPKLQFTLESARYATGLTSVDRHSVPKRGQKLLILHYTVQNAGERDITLRSGNVNLQAVDELGQTHKAPNTFPMRVQGSATDADRTTLKPAQTLKVYRAIPVPNNLRIPKLVVDPAPGNHSVIRYDLRDKITPVPQALRGLGPESVADVIPAGMREYLGLGGLDVKITGVNTSTNTQIGTISRRLPAGHHWVIVDVTARSRFNESEQFRITHFTDTQLIGSSGTRVNPVLFLHPSQDISIDSQRLTLDPNMQQEGSFRLAFQIFESETPQEIRIAEYLGGPVYSVPFSGGTRLQAANLGDTFPLGVYYFGLVGMLLDPPLFGGNIIAIPPPADPDPEDPPAEQPAMSNLSGATFTMTKIKATRMNESEDEPYVLAIPFRGTLGPNSRGPGVVVLEMKMITMGPVNFIKRVGVEYALPATLTWRNDTIQPYEFYGVYYVLMEADNSSHAVRMEFARKIAASFINIRGRIINTAPDFDVRDASKETQLNYVTALADQFGEWIRLMDAQSIIHDSGNYFDPDDYVGDAFCVSVHLPSLSPTEISARWNQRLSGWPNYHNRLLLGGSKVSSVGFGSNGVYDITINHTIRN